MSKKITYKNEPDDGMAIREGEYEVISRTRQRAFGLPPSDPPGTEYEAGRSGNLVTLTPGRGGRRAGAGRKASGHVRMQLSVSPATRRKIESLAKRHKLTLSQAVERMAADA